MGILEWIILLAILVLIVPELFGIVLIILLGIGEFILRLFGKSFDVTIHIDKKNEKT